MADRKKRLKKSRKNKKFHEKHDLQHYAMVLYVASVGVSILFLLGSYTTATGLATATGELDVSVAIDYLEVQQLFTGDGPMQCMGKCAREGKYAVISSVDGEIVDNNAEVDGEWTCLCAG